jgi:hypothetical protein
MLALLVGCTAPRLPAQVTDTPVSEASPTSQPTRGPTPELVIDPQPAPQSGQVRVAGTGFAGGETVVISVVEDTESSSPSLPLGTATTGADGAFAPLTLMLPDQLQSGGHSIQAFGETSQLESSGTLWIRAPQPWLVLDSYDIPQYGELGLVAGGFEPMDQIQLSLELAGGAAQAPINLASFNTDQAGNGQWLQVKLPRASAGTYTLVLHGRATSAELKREMQVTPLKPEIELSPWAGPPGLPVQLNVRGFAPSERVEVSLPGVSDPTTLQADQDGNVWGGGPVRIPQTAQSGTLTLTLVGDDSGATASIDFKVLPPKPWLELTNWSGAPGAPVGFGGGGWIAGEKVAIHMGSATNPPLEEVTTDDGGWLKGAPQVYIPLDVNDNVIFVAQGEQSHLIGAATFTVVFPFGLHPQPLPTPAVN